MGMIGLLTFSVLFLPRLVWFVLVVLDVILLLRLSTRLYHKEIDHRLDRGLQIPHDIVLCCLWLISTKQRVVPQCSICLEDCEDMMGCGHAIHIECAQQQIQIGFSPTKDKLSWNCIQCPLCRAVLSHPELCAPLEGILTLKEQTDIIAGRHLLDNLSDVINDISTADQIRSSPKHQQISIAYQKFAFFQCNKCKLPYCGGTVSCAEETNHSDEDLLFLCSQCSIVTRPCGHPASEMLLKCIKCCSVATYWCRGTDFYCDRCHDNLNTLFPCPGEGKCPLGIIHPENTLGSHAGGHGAVPFVLGCKTCGKCAFDGSHMNFSDVY